MTRSTQAAVHGGCAPPAVLLEAIEARCGALAATASGRVFELPQQNVGAALEAELARGARYDTILSFMRTPQIADLAGFVVSLEGILAEDGWILMVEPSGAGRERGFPWVRLPSRSPRLGRDVVGALRAGGFAVTDLHRCEAPSAPRPWRNYVELRARRESPWVRSTGGDAGL